MRIATTILSPWFILISVQRRILGPVTGFRSNRRSHRYAKVIRDNYNELLYCSSQNYLQHYEGLIKNAAFSVNNNLHRCRDIFGKNSHHSVTSLQLKKNSEDNPNSTPKTSRNASSSSRFDDTTNTTTTTTTSIPKAFQRGSNKVTVLAVGIASLLITSSLALTGLLTSTEYSPSLILNDASVTVFIAVVAGLFVKSVSTAATNGWIEPRDSRKLIHILSAPVFVVFWPLYSNVGAARYFAAIVPFLNGLRLFLAGNDYGDESELANAVSRSGDAKEALQGPFIYVVILLSAVLLFWRNSFIGVVAISVMAAGDGMADIIGRRFGKGNKWSFCPDKSVAGTIAFAVASLGASYGLVQWLIFTGCLTTVGGDLLTRLATVCGLSALIELAPFGDDNYNVPITAALLSYLLLSS